MKNILYKLICVGVLLSSFGALKAQVDKIHYIPPFYTAEHKNFADVGEHTVILSTLIEDEFDVTIRTKTTYLTTLTISASSPAQYVLPDYVYSNSSGGTNNIPQTIISQTNAYTVLDDQGLIIEGDYDFFVNISTSGNNHGDILTSKGTVGMGTLFFSGHLPNVIRDKNWDRSNFVSVMATEDNTVVTFSNPNILWKPQTTNTFSVTLQKEECYVIGANLIDDVYTGGEDPNDLIGTKIESTKPIVVNSGSWGGSAQNQGIGNDYDIGFDQLVPYSKIGNDFITIKGTGSKDSGSEKVIIVSPADNNAIYVNDAFVATLDMGEKLILDQSAYSIYDNIYIKTDLGAYVFQSILAKDKDSNTGFIFIPNLSCEGYKEVSISYADFIADPEMLIVARLGNAGEIPDIRIDSTIINTTEGNGSPVIGNDGWVTYKISNPSTFDAAGDGNYQVKSDYAVNVALSLNSGVIGGGGFYSGFGVRPTISSAPRILNTNGCAPGNMVLVADDNFYSDYQWYKDGAALSGETNNVFYPTTRGIYTLKGLTDCGTSLESDPVDVKTCIYWESKDGDGNDVKIWEDATALTPPEDPFVFLEFRMAEALDFDIYIRYRTIIPSYLAFPATAGIGGDFIPIDYNAQIYIPADSLTGYTDPIWILPDYLDEEDEGFGIEIIDVLDADGNIGAVVQDDQVSVTILDDDSVSTIVNVEDDFSVVENEGRAVFTVSLTEASGRSVYVDYKTVANTAFPSNDYYSKSGTITFLEGETQKTISVPIINRNGYNGERDFHLVLENPNYCILGNDTSTCTIVDKEGEDVFLYYVNDTSTTEGNPFSFTLRLSQLLAEPFSFRLAFQEGTATAADFVDNTIDTTTLTANVGVTDLSGNSVSQLDFSEGAGNAAFYVQLSNVMDVPVTVKYKTTANTADENLDYEPVNNMLLFMPGETTKKLEIPLIDDTRTEPVENFLFHITEVVNGYNSQNKWEVNIVDNDPIPVISLEGDKEFLEDERNAPFKVSLSGKSNDTINVTYSVYEYDINPNIATPGDGTQVLHDFRPASNQRITFYPGDSVKYISPEIYNNDGADFSGIAYSDEIPEKFYVQLSNVEDLTTATISTTANKSVATINEEIVQAGIDKHYIYLNSNEVVTEGADFSFDVNRFTGSIYAWRFEVQLTNVSTTGADFSSTPTTGYINVSGAATTTSITFSTFNDALVESDENFTLEIISAQYQDTALASWTNLDILPGRGTVYGTIEDNDLFDAPTLYPDTFYVGTNQPLVIAAEHGVLENDVIYTTNPASTVTWNGSLNATYGTLTGLGSDGSFTYTPATDYTGTFSMNYNVQTSKGENASSSVYFTVVDMPTRYYISPGDSLFEVSIPTYDDALVEGDEQFTLTAFDLSSTSVRILPGRNVSTGTIIDDDLVPLAVDDYFYVNEDNALMPPTANVLDNDIISDLDTLTEIVVDTLGPYLQHGSLLVDMALDGTFTYMPDPGYSGRDSFLYTIRDSRTDSIYSPAQSYDESSAVVIIDIINTNDYPVAVDDYFTIDEDDSATEFNLTENDLDPDYAGLKITSVWGNNLGTVQLHTDSTILFDPVWFGTDTVYYRLDDLDGVDDPDTGIVIFTISGEVDRFFSILKDENILESAATPSGTMTFTVTLNQSSYKTREVSYRTVAISGNSIAGTDFISTTGTLTFPSGTTQQTVDVTVMGRGDSDDYDHRFTLELYDASVGTYLGTQSSAYGTILNVDPDLRYIMITNDVTVDEGDTAVFEVMLVGDPLTYNLPFSAVTSDGTAIGLLDYENSSFLAGSGFVTPDLTMSSSSGSYSVNEGAGAITIDFDLSEAVTADVSFSYTIHNPGSSTAVNEEDYTGNYRFVNIPAGSTHASINIPIIDDELDEEDETFTIDLNDAVNVKFLNDSETITILDNDAQPTLILAGDRSVMETELSLTYPVKLSRISGKTISVRLNTDDNGSATDNGQVDFEATQTTLTFNPGDSIKYFEVQIYNNSKSDADEETFDIYADNASNVTLPSPVNATITIYDSGVSNVIYLDEDFVISNANDLDFHINTNSNITSSYVYMYKLAISGDHSSILKNWVGDYPDILSGEWIYSSNPISAVDFQTGASVTNSPSQTFELEIIAAEYGTGPDKWNFVKSGDLTIVPNRNTASITIANNLTERYAQTSSFIVHPGQTLSANFLDNDNMINLNIGGINFTEITSAYFPYDHRGNLTLGTDGSLTYSPPLYADTGAVYLGEFRFVATIQGNDPTNFNSYHEYNDTIIIYVEEEPESTNSGTTLPFSTGTTQLKVPTIDDILDESDEDFYITISLSDTSVVKLRNRTTARALILDNDDTPTNVLFPDIATTYERQPVTINVLDNDDPDSLYNFTLTSVSDPANGSIVSFDANGNVTYQSDIYFIGADNFTYTVTSSEGLSYPMTVSVQVESIEDMENKRSLYCSDGSSYLTYSPSAAFDANTFEVWIKPVGSATGGIANLGGGKTISRNASGNVVLSGFTGTIYVDGVAGSSLTNDKWQHLLIASGTSFNVSSVVVGHNGTSGMQAYYDEMRIWNKSLNSASSATQLMFKELYYKDASGQLESMIDGTNVFNPAYASWGNLLFHAKFNTTDFYDVIGWSSVVVSGSANISVDLPFNHFLSTAVNNDWDWEGNWHFGKDYPNTTPPEYIILNPAGANNPYIHLGSSYSVNSQTTIKNIIVLENADFMVNKGVLKISGNIFRAPNNRVVYMRGSDGIRITKSINISY